MKRRFFKGLTVVNMLLLASVLNAGAVPLQFSLDLPYGGQAAPSGSKPWLAATFTDRDPIDLGGGLKINVVELSLAAKNLARGEFIDSWFFNIDPSYKLPLTLDYLKPETNPGPNGKPRQEPDKLDANGKNGEGTGFDLLFDFYDETGTSASADLFGPNESVSYLIKGVNIFASSFNFLNTKDLFFSAAQIRGIGPNSAFAWIADARDNGPGPGPAPVPEPATMLLLGAGSIGMAFFGRKKLKK